MNPRLGTLEPYQSALHAIDEALRNCIAVGGNLEHTAILDNFCWGNCNRPELMGALVQAAKACYDGALAYGTPFISGKDSLNNEFRTETGQTIIIPPTLLISAISIIEDISCCITADAKQPGNILYLLGKTSTNLGGSHYLLVENIPTGNDVPPVNPAESKKVMQAVQKAIAEGLLRSCHDLSEGGLAVAAAEMAFAGGLGVEIDIAGMLNNSDLQPVHALFAEDAGRFLVEVRPENCDAFEQIVKDIPHTRLGEITEEKKIIIKNGSNVIIDVSTDEAKQAWKGTFDW